MLSKIFGFLFGKKPQIFDKNGAVQHDLGQKKWDAWQARYLKGDEYNWRNHTGMRAKDIKTKKT